MIHFLQRLAIAAFLVFASSSQTFSESVTTPLATRLFCGQHPDVCRGGGQNSVALTADVLSTLQSVNSAVNESITSVAERVDVWTLNPSRGDCEDYALTKRALLIRLGLPRNSLRIGLGRLNGSGHTVLVVLTDKGALVLDNVNRRIVALQKNGISLSSLSAGNLMAWDSLD